MREKWQDLFLKGMEVETDAFRLGDLFKESVAREIADTTSPRGRNRTAVAIAARPTTLRLPDWIDRQASRVGHALKDVINGRPAIGEAYYGLPGVQPRTQHEHAKHAKFIRQRDAFHAQIRRQDHLQRNINAARREPGKYVGDVALGTLKGVSQVGLNLANDALMGYGLQHPEMAAGADAVNRLSDKRVFDVSQAPWGAPMAQFAQPHALLQPHGDVQHQWSYLGHFGGLVGTGVVAEALLPARVVAPPHRPPRSPATPTGQYYSVGYEAQLNPIDFGRRHKVHVNRASEQLDDDLMSDPAWAAGMEEMIPGLHQSVSKVGRRGTPDDWVWHHDGLARRGATGADEYGFLQLTPEAQHQKDSVFWNTFHPDPRRRGGYAIWAVPAGAPRRR